MSIQAVILVVEVNGLTMCRRLSDEQRVIILNHAVKHDYPSLMDRAALVSARCNLAFILTRLTPEVIPAWVRIFTNFTEI